VGADHRVLRAPLEQCGAALAAGQVDIDAGRPGAPRYAGIWAICCGVPQVPGIDVDLSGGEGRPALFQWGTKDPVIGPDAPHEVISTLSDGGWALRHHSYEMAHSQTIEMMVDARDWLAGVL
ncbi:MAG: hypothetical protein AAF548_11540, partial [Actinomycetota bacterium]